MSSATDSLSELGNQFLSAGLDIAKSTLGKTDTAKQSVDQKAADIKGKFDVQTIAVYGGIAAVIAFLVFKLAK